MSEAQTRQFVTLYQALQGFDDRDAQARLACPRLCFAGSADEIDYGERWGGPPLAHRRAGHLAVLSRRAYRGTVAFALTAFEQRDWRHENSPPSSRSNPTVRLRRLPLPIRGHRYRGPLVPALRPVVSRCRRDRRLTQRNSAAA